MKILIFVIFRLLISFAIGRMGENRKIGYGWSFSLSLFLSPIIAWIITLCSRKNSEVHFINTNDK
ncbi:hypothetical protein K4L44_06630 [Halosquirtibacter laminarini]|uniref:Uncharacterized protein n=1 Tax=Halosquirtibacter laminarini TaxID=3374600 RepID=A0AC61NII8_9BACT|nr:hypothetical protein K4L44_06630 [Prolixibacteraceae bacterium]